MNTQSLTIVNLHDSGLVDIDPQVQALVYWVPDAISDGYSHYVKRGN
jgi:hypothetical protein